MRHTDTRNYLATLMLFEQPDGTVHMIVTHTRERPNTSAVARVVEWIKRAADKFVIDWG